MAIVIAPVGIFAPLEWVWGIPLALSGVVLLVYRIPRRILRDARLLLGFLALSVLTAWRSEAPSSALEMGFAFAAAVAVYGASRILFSEDPTQLLAIRRVSLAWVAVLSALLFASRFIEVPDGVTFGYPLRHAAMAMVPMVAISLSVRRRYWLSGVLGLVAVVAALVTGARTASVVLVVSLAGLLVDRLSSRARLTAGAGLILVLVLAVNIPSVQQRWLGRVFEDPYRDIVNLSVNGGGRSDVWRETLQTCQGSVLIGAGLGTSNHLASNYNESFPDPHNEFIRFYCDTGIVGSALLWGFFALSFLRLSALMRVRPHNPSSLGGLLGLFSLLAFSTVWNPMTAAEFMIPLMVLLAWSDEAAVLYH